MKRKIGWILFGLCLAFPVVLACLPATGWIVKSDARVATGLSNRNFLGFKDSDAWDAVAAGDCFEKAPEGFNRESRLCAVGCDSNSIDLTASYDITRKNWKDVDFLAAYILRCSPYAWIPIHTPKKSDGGYPEAMDRSSPLFRTQRETWIRMRDASDQGARLEPSNAFFPAVSAALSEALDERGRALENLEKCSYCPAWNDHAAQLTTTFRKVLLARFGYRGWAAIGNARVEGRWIRQMLTALSDEISRMPLDYQGVRTRRHMLQVAAVSYEAAASFEDVDLSSRMVNRIVWSGAAKQMTQAQARKAVLSHIHTISLLVSTGDPLQTAKGFTELVAAQDFKGHLGPYWEGNGPIDWDKPDDSFFGRLTEPWQSKAGQYTVVALSMCGASALAICLLGILRRVPQRAEASFAFRKRWWLRPLLDFVLFFCFLAQFGFLLFRFPFMSWPIWLGAVAVPVIFTVAAISSVARISMSLAARSVRRWLFGYIAASAVIFSLGVLWQ